MSADSDCVPRREDTTHSSGPRSSGEPDDPANPLHAPVNVAEPADPAVSAQLVDLGAGIARLHERLTADTERAVARERVIDRQHAEIERLRATQRADQMRPTVTDLYRLRNDLLRQAASTGDSAAADVASLLESYAGTVEEALERCGVTVLPHEVGTRFVAGRHQLARVVDTDDAERDGTIAAVAQDGYAEIDGTLVAPPRVELYRYVTKETTDD